MDVLVRARDVPIVQNHVVQNAQIVVKMDVMADAITVAIVHAKVLRMYLRMVLRREAVLKRFSLL